MRLSKMLYVEFSEGDNLYDSEVLRVTSPFTLPDKKPFHCVRSKVRVDFCGFRDIGLVNWLPNTRNKITLPLAQDKQKLE